MHAPLSNYLISFSQMILTNTLVPPLQLKTLRQGLKTCQGFQVMSLAIGCMYLLAPRNGVPLKSPSVSEKFEEGSAFHQVRRNCRNFFKEQGQPRHTRNIASTSTSSTSRHIREKRLPSRFTREAGKKTAIAISRV